jgi:1-deoxy-D-xylulose-5-phosphate reductoisomerase
MDAGGKILKGVSILGSTGSIGVNTLNVIAQHRDQYHVVALAANSNVKVLVEQCLAWHPPYAVMSDANSAQELEQLLRNSGLSTVVLSGNEGLEKVVQLAETDYVMAAIVGAAGLLPTLAAAHAGKRILLANKEALVMSGRLFMDAVKDHHAELLPIDSEHNAIFQCMPWNHAEGLAQCGVRKIMLTASGGPFRTTPVEDLSRMTPAQACAHPNWVMGRKISVDSATMMNKGLEVIEACWLFDTTPDQVQVVLHPQSIIHSLVEYVDGSVLAQLGNPDMRTPIAHALAWPERITSGVPSLNLFAIARLDFEPPDELRYPCLRLARQAMQSGGTATAILNAANEVAVAKFLSERIRFTDIARVVEATLENVAGHAATTLEVILGDDQAARIFAGTAIEELAA